MAKDIKLPDYSDLAKILHEKMVEEAEYALIHQHDDEDIDDAVINGLDDD
jgi:hypothetical protein